MPRDRPSSAGAICQDSSAKRGSDSVSRSGFVGAVMENPSAFDDVDGQATKRRLLILRARSSPVWRIVSITASRLTDMATVPAQRQIRGVDRLDRTLSYCARCTDLDQPADRIAGQPEIMLHADLGRILDLSVGPAERREFSAPAAIEHATPTSPWHPISAAEIDARFL